MNFSLRKNLQLCTLTTMLFIASTTLAMSATTERISNRNDGTQSFGESTTVFNGAISADGRFVTFDNSDIYMIPGNTNIYGSPEIFVHDRETGTTRWVSIPNSDHQGNLHSSRPTISANGEIVTFMSYASNLVAGDTNNLEDVFAREWNSGNTELVSVGYLGDPANNQSNYYAGPKTNSDGRYVVFYSAATNLVPDDTNGVNDVFIHDRATKTTKRVSVASDGNQGNKESRQPSISADGRFIAFYSLATNLVEGDVNSAADIFVHDNITGATELVSLATDGTQGNNHSSGYVSLSADGRFVAFMSASNNLAPGASGHKIYVRDRLNKTTTLASINYADLPATGYSSSPTISSDGRFVAFEHYGYPLVLGANYNMSNVYIRDLKLNSTEIVSFSKTGGATDKGSYSPSLSGNGRFVVFTSAATNIVENDTNNRNDVFIRDLATDIDQDGFITFSDVITEDCNDNDPLIHPEAQEIKHDNIDQDCNGYDLTIDATATYTTGTDKLAVQATSSLGGSANLAVEGMGAMTWSSNQTKWQFELQPSNGDPGVITISGTEGIETISVQVMGPPAEPGPPAETGKPTNPGPPAETGKPTNPGRPL